jgi:thioredoxin-dependent peroxiredoxin
MGNITLRGKNIETIGELPGTGENAPDFNVVKGDLVELTLKDYAGKRLILNIFPSLDTDLCAVSVRKFNQAASGLDNTAVLCISADLPFAAARFCGAEGIENVETGSVFRHPSFGKNYGVEMTTGILKGLLSRAIVVIDESGKVIYTQQVPEIGEEPDYDTAIAAL